MDATTSIGGVAPQPMFTFRGRLSTMFRIHLENLVLTIVTLGVYRFWAKTRMRKYLWSHIEIAGDPLEYTGTGKELFLGFTIVFFVILLPVFILPAVILPFVEFGIAWLHPVIQAVQFGVIFLLLPVAIYRARRYRLSRSRWRGVRGALGGKAMEFAGKYIMYGGLQVITLGLMTPTAHNRVAHYMYNNVAVGDTPLTFTAKTGPMYRKLWWAIAMFFALIVAFMVVPTAIAVAIGGGLASTGVSIGLGSILAIAIWILPYMWYNACETIYFVGETALGDLHFALNVSPWRMIGFNIVNLLILVATLTLALPWVYKRTLDFYARFAIVMGDINALSVRQSADQGPKQGEGLADAFDPAGF